MEKRASEYAGAAAEIKAAALLTKAGRQPLGKAGKVVIEIYTSEDMDEVLRIGKVAQKRTSAYLILASEKDCKFAAFCSVEAYDVRSLFKDAFEKAGGKGGGGPSFFQCQFASTGELLAFLSALKAEV